MAALKFYDLKAKKSFTTTSYKPMMKSGRKFAVATTPSGGKAYRIMAKK
jgi:hypothetical protein